MKVCYLLTLLIVLTISYPQAQTVRDVLPGKVGVTAFKVEKADKIKVTGTGGIYEDDWQTVVYYGWIINSHSRKVVWHQIDVMDNMDLEYGEFSFKDEVSLEKGTYELYFTGAYVNRDNNWNGSMFNVFSSSQTDDFKSNLPSSYLGINKVKFRNAVLD